MLLTVTIFAQDKPNILVIMVDDVAPNALSAYSLGLQYPTPNIDRARPVATWLPIKVSTTTANRKDINMPANIPANTPSQRLPV